MSRARFIDQVESDGLLPTFTVPAWQELAVAVKTDERVRRFVEWEVYGPAVVAHTLLDAAIANGDVTILALPLEARPGIQSWAQHNDKPVAFIDSNAHAYAISIPDGPVATPALVERIEAFGGIVHPFDVTKEEWVHTGGPAGLQHIHAVDVRPDSGLRAQLAHLAETSSVRLIGAEV